MGLGFCALDTAAASGEGPTPAKPVLAEVDVTTSPLPGTSIDSDKVPANVQTLRSSDLTREGSASLTGALGGQLGSVNISDDLADPFQPDLLYRGFEASPVLGTPEGLAVYQNGVRINEAFGDVVNWDLIPDLAIDRVDLVSASPVYGLNALGGGVAVTMKNGFSYRAGSAEALDGSFGQRAISADYGANDGRFGIYLAGRALDERGWRQFSRDSLRQVYGDLSVRTDRLSADLSFTRANNALDGQGSAPVQELAVSRSLVFTGPQGNDNTLDFVTLNLSYQASKSLSWQGVLYFRRYSQSVANGNTTDYTACATSDALCQSDGTTPVTNAAGAPLPDVSNGGTLTIGENDSEEIRTSGQGAALQLTETQSIAGHGNHFSAGATVDYARTNFQSSAQLGVIDATLTVLPSDLIVDTPEGTDFSATPVLLRAVNTYYGAYATDTFDVTPELSVTASGRYNIAQIKLTDRRGTNLTGDNRYEHLNPALGGAYKVSDGMTAYAGVAENTRTPTASEIECSDPLLPCLLPSNLAGDPPTLRQVVALTVEAGLRGRTVPGLSAADGLTWSAGIFRTRLQDDIYGISTSVSTGFFQNIGSTRRQGVEAGMTYHARNWSAFANYSYVDATFQSALTLNSPSNPFQDDDGNIHVVPGDRLPGIPLHRLKLGLDGEIAANWTAGISLTLASNAFYRGDESNQNAPLLGYHVVNLHTAYRLGDHFNVFADIRNLLNARYSNFGLFSDPTGVGAPGVPAEGVSNGPGVDNRFQSPAAPFSAVVGVRFTF